MTLLLADTQPLLDRPLGEYAGLNRPSFGIRTLAHVLVKVRHETYRIHNKLYQRLVYLQSKGLRKSIEGHQVQKRLDVSSHDDNDQA